LPSSVFPVKSDKTKQNTLDDVKIDPGKTTKAEQDRKTVAYENLLFEYLNSIRPGGKSMEDGIHVYDVYEEDTSLNPSVEPNEFIRASAIAKFDPNLDRQMFGEDDEDEDVGEDQVDEDVNAEDHPNNDYPDEDEDESESAEPKGSSDDENDEQLSLEDRQIAASIRKSLKTGKGTDLSDDDDHEQSVEYDEEI